MNTESQTSGPVMSIYDGPQSNQHPYQPPKPPMGGPFDQPGFDPMSGKAPPFEAKKKSGCTCVGCLLGCLGMTIVISIAVGIGTWWTIKKIPDMARSFVAKAVEESDMTPEDKRVVMQQVDRLIAGYKQGKVDMQKVGKLAENFVESPLMDLMIAYAAKANYIDSSGLSDEEKAEAERAIQRVARGVIEHKIPDDQLDVALNHISNTVGNGGRQFRETVSDAELRAFIKECKRIADEAEIPDEEYKVDIGAELKKLVDEALGEAPAPTTAEPEKGPPLPSPTPVPAPSSTPNASTTATEALPAEKPEPLVEKPPADSAAESPAEKP